MARPALRIDAVLVQAVIAGALSFAHLHDLAAAAGQSGWKAWAYPVSVDLLLVAAWRRLHADGPSRLAWCWFLIALVASLGANVTTAGLLDLGDVPPWLRILVATWPALALMGGTPLAHSPADPAPAHGPAPETAAPEPGPAPGRLLALVASLGANATTAGLLALGHVPPSLRILVAAWPALAFLGGTLLAHSPADPAPAPHPAPETAATEPGPAPAPPVAPQIEEDP